MQNEPATKKLLLTGCSSSGKTSIHLIVFGAHPSKDSLSTHNLQGSIITQNKFMGSMSVTIWHSEIEPKYLGSRKEDFFRNVGVLVYVFDVEDERAETMENFKKCVERVSENSKDTPVFVLIHKLDRVASESKVTIFKEKKAKVLKEAESMNVNIKGIYGTSIWDDTLYRAWSEMVQVLTPNLSVYKDTLKHLTTACDCNEAVLFDKKTFLMIEHYEKNPNRDLEKYERVSTIIKQFKLNCKTGTDITSLEIRNTKFVAVIKSFTENTSMMVISLDPKIEPNALDMSVDGAKRYFEKKNENVLQA